MILSVGHCHYNFAAVIKVNKAMKKITKLKLCAWVLVALTIVTDYYTQETLPTIIRV